MIQNRERNKVYELTLRRRLTAGCMPIWLSSTSSPAASISCSLLTYFSWSDSATLKSKASLHSPKPSPTKACFPLPSYGLDDALPLAREHEASGEEVPHGRV